MKQISISMLTLLASTNLASAEPAISQIAAFDLAKNELPEGLAVRGHDIYVGMATSQKVVKISGDTQVDFAQFPALGDDAGFLTGLHIDKDGAVFAGLASFDPAVPSGIYRVSAEGGNAELFATHDGMAFPNDVAIDTSGDMIVTDTMAGLLWRVSPEGVVTKWFEDPLLQGDPSVCAPDEMGFGLGVNGIDFAPDGRLFVAVTDRATVYEVTVEGKTATGLVAVTETNCDLLEGADGIKATDAGIVVAANRSDQISFVSYDGTVTSVARGTGLDFPASIAAHNDGFVVTNFGLMRASGGAANVGLIDLKM